MEITAKREYLERNLVQINTVLSAVLGFKTELQIKEKKPLNKEVYFNLDDDRNIVEFCGVMKHAFKEVTIHTFNVWWDDKGVTLQFDFNYTHTNGGSNGSELCVLRVENDFVQIIR